MPSPKRKYRDAAIAYLIYGLVYLAGAIYMAQTGMSARAAGPGSTWWFLLGALMVVLFPVMIWKEFKWVTRALALLVFVRVLGLFRLLLEGGFDAAPLPWGAEISAGYGAAVFLGISMAACYFLARAGWASWLERRTSAGAST